MMKINLRNMTINYQNLKKNMKKTIKNYNKIRNYLKNNMSPK